MERDYWYRSAPKPRASDMEDVHPFDLGPASPAIPFGQDAQKRLLQLIEPLEEGRGGPHPAALILQQVRGLNGTQDTKQALACDEMAGALEVVNRIIELVFACMRCTNQIRTGRRALSQERLDELSLQGRVAERQELELLRVEDWVFVRIGQASAS